MNVVHAIFTLAFFATWICYMVSTIWATRPLDESRLALILALGATTIALSSRMAAA